MNKEVGRRIIIDVLIVIFFYVHVSFKYAIFKGIDSRIWISKLKQILPKI